MGAQPPKYEITAMPLSSFGCCLRTKSCIDSRTSGNYCGSVCMPTSALTPPRRCSVHLVAWRVDLILRWRRGRPLGAPRAVPSISAKRSYLVKLLNWPRGDTCRLGVLRSLVWNAWAMRYSAWPNAFLQWSSGQFRWPTSFCMSIVCHQLAFRLTAGSSVPMWCCFCELVVNNNLVLQCYGSGFQIALGVRVFPLWLSCRGHEDVVVTATPTKRCHAKTNDDASR